MKKYYLIILLLILVSIPITSCQNADDKDTVPETTTAELPNKQTKEPSSSEQMDLNGNYLYLKFPSSNNNWQLIYDNINYDNKLILTNGKKSFIYGDYRTNNQINDYNIQFTPQNKKDSAQVIISSDEKYGIIIYCGTEFSNSDYEHDRILVVSLQDGRALNYINIADIDILSVNNLPFSTLDSYRENTFGYPKYTLTLNAEFTENNIINITANLISEDKQLNISADYTCDPSLPQTFAIPGGYKSTYINTSVCYIFDKDTNMYRYADSAETFDGNKYVQTIIPEYYASSGYSSKTAIADYGIVHLNNDLTDSKRAFSINALNKLDKNIAFDKNIINYFDATDFNYYKQNGEVSEGITEQGYSFIAYSTDEIPGLVFIKISDEYFIILKYYNKYYGQSPLKIFNDILNNLVIVEN